uniref:High light inducible protein n=1 Tax=Leersia perrieri TaxID=77586 RepID=A0A0D9WW54_9ORYZ
MPQEKNVPIGIAIASPKPRFSPINFLPCQTHLTSGGVFANTPFQPRRVLSIPRAHITDNVAGHGTTKNNGGNTRLIIVPNSGEPTTSSGDEEGAVALMSADAEIWNGRFAMLGLVALAFTEFLTGSPLVNV